ncbi:hypothetical protein WICPIJ_005352 [Wickerhamomyces pijperi]|uniref:Cardiolipin synthase n=1 Tax=Wickerhamomyces pijperi TaxID=599730 RepID=A0A9P8Q3N9_WICPI|nr:hypothetical protein WICPIJ_005352 [Wickerhamomyces pijperi]
MATKNLILVPGISGRSLLSVLQKDTNSRFTLRHHTRSLALSVNVRGSLTTRTVVGYKSISSCLQQCRHLSQFPTQLTSQDSKKQQSKASSPPLASITKQPKVTKIESPLLFRENIYTIPNILTLTRIATAPLIGFLITQSNPTLTLSVFAYSCITDLLDGFIARRYNMGSVLGSVLDPMADKLLMVISTVALSISGGMPMYLAIAILGRDLMLTCMSFYIRYVNLPMPKTIKRFFDPSALGVEVRPTMISKINTALQMFYIGAAIVNPVLQEYVSVGSGSMIDSGMSWFGGLVFITTVWSGASYVFGANRFRLLSGNVKK